MEDVIDKLRERLATLSYNDVRKEARLYSISARGKKIELIDKILDAETTRREEGGGGGGDTASAAMTGSESDNDGKNHAALAGPVVGTMSDESGPIVEEKPYNDMFSEARREVVSDSASQSQSSATSENAANEKMNHILSSEKKIAALLKAKEEQLKFTKEKFEQLTNKNKLLADECVRQEHKKPSAAKVRDLQNKLDEHQIEMENFHANNFTAKESVDKLHVGLANQDDNLLVVYKTWSDKKAKNWLKTLNFCKVGTSTKFVVENVSRTAVCFFVCPNQGALHVSPQCTIHLQRGEAQQVTVRCDRAFGGRLTLFVHATSVADHHGKLKDDVEEDVFADGVFRDVKTNLVSCEFSELAT